MALLLAPLWSAPRPRGRLITVPRREIMHTLRQVRRTGCAWRSLPHDFPDWHLVYSYFRQWRRTGLWHRIHEALCPQVWTAAGLSRIPVLGIGARPAAKGNRIASGRRLHG